MASVVALVRLAVASSRAARVTALPAAVEAAAGAQPQVRAAGRLSRAARGGARLGSFASRVMALGPARDPGEPMAAVRALGPGDRWRAAVRAAGQGDRWRAAVRAAGQGDRWRAAVRAAGQGDRWRAAVRAAGQGDRWRAAVRAAVPGRRRTRRHRAGDPAEPMIRRRAARPAGTMLRPPTRAPAGWAWAPSPETRAVDCGRDQARQTGHSGRNVIRDRGNLAGLPVAAARPPTAAAALGALAGPQHRRERGRRGLPLGAGRVPVGLVPRIRGAEPAGGTTALMARRPVTGARTRA